MKSSIVKFSCKNKLSSEIFKDVDKLKTIENFNYSFLQKSKPFCQVNIDPKTALKFEIAKILGVKPQELLKEK